MMFTRFLFADRRIPAFLEPEPLRRILADDLLDDFRHADRKVIEILVRVTVIFVTQDFADDDFVFAVRLAQDKGRDNRRVEFA